MVFTISYSLLRSKLSLLQQQVNSVLNDITDFTISIELNKDIEKSPIIHIKNQALVPAVMGSGFQKFIITVAIRLVLARNHPYCPSFLIIDEGFGCMDQEHLAATVDFLSGLRVSSDMDWLLFITHLPEMRTIISTPITVVRENNVSKIDFQ